MDPSIEPKPAPKSPAKHDRDLAMAISDNIQEQVKAEAALGNVPHPGLLLFSAAMGGIQNERVRVLGIIDALGQAAMDERNRCAGLETAARMAGEHAAGDTAHAQRTLHETSIRCLLGIKREINRDPDACEACQGAGKVPSRLIQGVMVNCEACAPIEPTIAAG